MIGSSVITCEDTLGHTSLLCEGAEHWVMTWIDWTSSKIGIFNANSCYGSVELALSAQGLSWLSLCVHLPLQLVHASHLYLFICDTLLLDS